MYRKQSTSLYCFLIQAIINEITHKHTHTHIAKDCNILLKQWLTLCISEGWGKINGMLML